MGTDLLEPVSYCMFYLIINIKTLQFVLTKLLLMTK